MRSLCRWCPQLTKRGRGSRPPGSQKKDHRRRVPAGPRIRCHPEQSGRSRFLTDSGASADASKTQIPRFTRMTSSPSYDKNTGPRIITLRQATGEGSRNVFSTTYSYSILEGSTVFRTLSGMPFPSVWRPVQPRSEARLVWRSFAPASPLFSEKAKFAACAKAIIIL